MAKEVIRLKGLSLNRDEQSAQHGELALCANAELHDGALRPSVFKGSMVQHQETAGGEQQMVDSVLQIMVMDSLYTATLLFVHETPSYRHYIGVYDNKLYWFKSDGTVGSPLEEVPQVIPTEYSHTPIHDFTGSDILSLTSVGNTLVVMTTSGVHYILWKGDDTGYKYLGTEIPFIKLGFRPTTDYKADYDKSTLPTIHPEWYQDPTDYDAWRTVAQGDTGYTQTYLEQPTSTTVVNIKSDKRSAVTDAVWALINRANDTIAKDGHFYAPFLIRYCYRMYDGSMYMHSAPVFMDVSLPLTQKVYCMSARRKSSDHSIILYGDDTTIAYYKNGSAMFDTNKLTFRYHPNNVGIEYKVIGTELQQLKADWADIIKSVDVFVSIPLTREDSGKLINRLIVEDYQYGARDSALERWKTTFTYSTGFGDTLYEEIVMDIPILDDKAYQEKIFNTSNFFKLTSYKLDDFITGSYENLKYEKSVVPNISVQEQMTDDYHTHNQLLPISNESGMYVYNRRLNLYGMKEQLFEGFSMLDMINDCTVDPNILSHNTAVTITKITVELDTDDGKKYVELTCNDTVYPYNITKGILFYPDSRATRMFLTLSDSTVMEFKMEPHNFLNGAVVTDLFSYIDMRAFVSQNTVPAANDEVLIANKVLTSEIDNPYYFPVEARNTVGNGKVKGIAAVTRALSQGQVGDHDLMVFSTDGIWVLKVASTGTYSAIHNISREVCSNPKSICQLDQSVIFATERSLARFMESDREVISEVLDGPITKWQTLLPSLWDAFPANGTPAQQAIRKLLNFGVPAIDMFNNGSTFYDYASARVIVLQQNTSQESVALVYSLRDGTWSTMLLPAIMAVVPGYPSPFVQLSSGKVMIMDEAYKYDAEAATTPALFITRVLTFSDTMDIIRGYCHYADSEQSPMLYLFGSNDQRTWRPLGSSNRWFYNYLPGTSFRFFRIAVYTQMKPTEEYQQLEVEFINKYTKL